MNGRQLFHSYMELYKTIKLLRPRGTPSTTWCVALRGDVMYCSARHPVHVESSNMAAPGKFMVHYAIRSTICAFPVTPPVRS